MLKAFRALPGQPQPIALRPWLQPIAHNESLSLVRARRPDAQLETAADLGDPASAEILESRARLRALAADLAQLTDRQRGALLMRELGGLPFTKIADALATSPLAAKQSLYDARRALQSMVDGPAMACDTVRGALSAGDRRILRRARMHEHLRGCHGCREFEVALHRQAS